jgi:hypothetical protein
MCNDCNTVTYDILLADDWMSDAFYSSLFISGLQIAIYSVIIQNPSTALKSDVGNPQMVISFIFSAVAISSTGFNYFLDLLAMAIGIRMSGRVIKGKIFLVSLIETVKFVLSFLAAIITVSSQSDPVSVVINSTAITVIMNVDQSFYQTLEMFITKSKELTACKEKAKIQSLLRI